MTRRGYDNMRLNSAPRGDTSRPETVICVGAPTQTFDHFRNGVLFNGAARVPAWGLSVLYVFSAIWKMRGHFAVKLSAVTCSDVCIRPSETESRPELVPPWWFLDAKDVDRVKKGLPFSSRRSSKSACL